MYTLAISLALIGLRRLEIAATLWLPPDRGVPSGEPAAERDPESAHVARVSQAALQRLPRSHRRDVFRLGYELGFASEWRGGFASSRAELKQQAVTLAEQHVAAARGLASQLGVGPVDLLPIVTAADFAALTKRIERDENGIAGRIERQLSLHHRHLYLLGMHIGKEAANIEMTEGTVTSPDERLIGRHARLTGIGANFWGPLAATPDNETPQQMIARYRAGLAALDASLGVD